MKRIPILLIFFAHLLAGAALAGEILVDLDAARLTPGKLDRWLNAGALGGYFAPITNAPIAGTVAGRAAVTFSGKGDFLKGSFAAPEAITGGRPFTLTAWVLNPELGNRQVICSWASYPAGAAEIGIGRGRNAAFYNSLGFRLGFEGGVPESKQWQHIAVVFDRSALKVYLNGRLNASKAAPLEIKGGEGVYIGAGWDGRKNVAMQALAGSLARLQVYSGALSEREIRNQVGFFTAFSPSPANREAVEVLRTMLRWESGSTDTASFHIYFGTRREQVEQRHPSASLHKENLPASVKQAGPVDLKMGQLYYWRVDQVDKDDKVQWPGEVWSFEASLCPARDPAPHNRIAAVKVNIAELHWVPGKYAASQDVYFGDSYEQVRNGSAQRVKGLSPKATSCPLPRSLKYGRTYYWRVDTHNGNLPRARGDVWSFRVEDEPVSGDVTFFLTSDLHYGASVAIAAANRATIDEMNSLPGKAYPRNLGGTVRTPRGVILLGDLIDDGNAEDAAEVWRAFTGDYGINGEGRLLYPVYEGVGNHDGDPNKPARAGIRARNRQRPAGTNVSPDGLHYSWDWDQVHLVHLNLFPGSAGEDIINPWGRKFEGEWRFPQHSLEFLIDDLAKNVGSSGRPVVLLQHYGWDDWGKGWWSDNERAAYFEAVKSYNVRAVFWGHSHSTQYFEWNGIPTWCVGSGQRDPQPGEFFVVRITPAEMTVAERKAGAWGLTAKTGIRGKTPALKSLLK